MIDKEKLKAFIIKTIKDNERAYGEINCLGDEEYPIVADEIIEYVTKVIDGNGTG